ncbi:MAG: class I SAM-dependent methyltransferase [Candidatus Paralactobacillus gallistercoris]|uniref:Class I SAM-dependent methyltransferase n=1 Tax=Candidatus Paralactobacillus gallistercoris TaxID=2838724 RepID=A0A948X102_9LACO|nr:class I SAM-dependent methyltransferase [Candidatus Paralactobacillus gallistercoris]
MSYYFSKQPDVAHDEQTWSFTLRGLNMRFMTDNGVFSKHTVDYGSRVLIAAITNEMFPAGPLLDMGCGYGPIGLSLAATLPRHVTMVDVNERALALAKHNAELNHLHNVDIFASDIYQNVSGKFAGVITNPPIRAGKQVVDQILTQAYDHLLPNGRLLAVIQKKQGAPSAKKLMMTTFGNATILKRDKGYYILSSQRN